MRHRIFIRNLRSGELFERFFIAAVSSLLLLRFYLYMAGYPQVGGGNLHIAHMLWGGVLMLAAYVLNFAFLGIRVQKLAAVVAGTGFGIFIDEIGKFLTKDNNYFFRPAIGIIYAVFVTLYLVVTFIGRRRKLSDREYQLNALVQLEEAVMRDFDAVEKARVQALLAHVAGDDPVTRQLKNFLDRAEIVKSPPPNRLTRLGRWLGTVYHRAWQRRGSNSLVQAFFIVEAGLFFIAMAATVGTNLDDIRHFVEGQASYGQSLVIGQLVATSIAGVLAVIGVVRLVKSRTEGLEYFRRATLVQLLLTEFFIFSRIQFGAIPGFIFNLLLLITISFALHEERRQI